MVLAAGMITWSAAAQTAPQSQTSGSASSNTEVGAKGANAQAQSNINADANQQVDISHQDTDKNKGAKAGESGETTATQSASASASGQPAKVSVASAGTLDAVLTHGIDARHVKEGQEVTAKTTSALKTAEGIEIPKGSKLIGHVTSAKARAKGDAESSLAMVFDKAVLKDGRELPLHAIIQGMSAPVSPAISDETYGNANASAGPMGVPQSAGRGGTQATRNTGGMVGAATGTVNNTVGAVGNTASGVASQAGQTVGGIGANAAGTVNSTASAVVGLPGMTLTSQSSHGTEASVITSSGKDVKLDSGTQLVLRVTAQ